MSLSVLPSGLCASVLYCAGSPQLQQSAGKYPGTGCVLSALEGNAETSSPSSFPSCTIASECTSKPADRYLHVINISDSGTFQINENVCQL